MRMKQIRRKERFMEKTVNERLFEQLMRAPHAVKRAVIESGFGDEMRRGPHGPGPGGFHRPDDGYGHDHGPEGFHHHCEGPGPMHGPGPEHCRRRDHGFGRERVLEVISRYEDGVRQKTLTEELRINPSSVSEMISKLENDGYVKRTVDPADKRATLITLTELGEARTAELQDEKNGKLDKAFRNLTDEEKEQLTTLLEKLTEDI